MSIAGKKILVTREKETGDKFSAMLTGAGAEVIFFPVIKITDIEDHSHMDKTLSELDKYNGIFFTSSNAVKYFFERAMLKNIKYAGRIYSIGEKTKEKVESYGYKNYFLPSVYSAEELLKELPIEEVKGKTFLIPRGNLSMEILQNGLSKYAKIDEVEVYRNFLPVEIENREKIEGMLNKSEMDCICFFSPSSIKNFIQLIPGFKQRNIKVAVIGKTTLKTAEEFGLRAEIVPQKSTAEDMASSIEKYFKERVYVN